MEPFGELLALGKAWVPFLVTLALAVTGLMTARYVVIVRRVGLASVGAIVRQLIMLALTAVAVAALLLALPVRDTTREQLFGLLGVLATGAIAFSSTTFIGNAMAGLMLRAVHNFRPGDFLRVGDHFGRVSEQGFLHTEIQTEERDLTTLPNLYLVTNPVTVVRSSGTIVSASVSLGYDVPPTKIESLLCQAVERAGLADSFVQIVELGDFSVTYRVAGFLADVKHLIMARSRLRAMMLDALHESGVEIVSPTFMNQRQLREGRLFIPPTAPPEGEARQLEFVPEALMFDKAEKAGSIEEARLQLERVADEMAATKKTLDETSAEWRKVALGRRLDTLAEQYRQFKDRLEHMRDAAEGRQDGR